MKNYGSAQCLPFDYLFGRKETPRVFEDLGEEEGLAETCVETEMILGRPMDDEQEQNGIEDVLDRLKAASDESYQEEAASVAPAGAEDFDEDHVTCYLREVA